MRFHIDRQQRGVECLYRACRKRNDRRDQSGQNEILNLDGPASSDVHANERQKIHESGDRDQVICRRWYRRRQSLCESNHVHSDGDGLSQIENDSDGTAELNAEAAADQVVGSATTNAGVCCDC